MKQIFFLLSMSLFSLSSFSQVTSQKIRLRRWTSEDCDNTFDPHRLKTRISGIKYTDTTTILP